MFKAGKEAIELSWHGYVHILSDIVPCECDDTVKFALPIFFYFIVCSEGMDEVVGMFFTVILDTKVIHYECELDWASDVPHAWGMCNFIIYEGAQPLSEYSPICLPVGDRRWLCVLVQGRSIHDGHVGVGYIA